MGTVQITHDFTGTPFTDNVTVVNGTVYTYGIGPIAVGSYTWSMTANDTYGNVNASENGTYTITQATQYLNIDATPSWSETYNTSTTVTGSNCPSQLSCLLYQNGTQVTNAATLNLSAGTYNYTFNTSGNVNYTLASNSSLLLIAKATPEGAINSTDSDWSIEAGTQITIGYEENNTGDSDLTYIIYRNGTNIGSGETWSPGVGSYEYILNTTGGNNYTANNSMDNDVLVVVDTVAPNISIIIADNGRLMFLQPPFLLFS